MASTDRELGSNSKTGDLCLSDDEVELDFDSGDPMIYRPYWKRLDNECSLTIKASGLMSYFVNPKEGEFVYQMTEFTDAVRRMHRLVGNAVTEGRHIIGGTGATQLFTLAVHALASTVKSPTNKKRVPVVCAEPCFWLYGAAVKEQESHVYEWHGDANTFQERGPYIEVVTSPNHPDGTCRKPVVNREGGMVIYDLTYYWPQYSPITAPADYDIMLFTMSKATGHAGSRVGWVIVKDAEVAAKIMKKISLLSVGTCQEGQLRATKVLQFIADSYEHAPANNKLEYPLVPPSKGFFEYGHQILAKRWAKLRGVVDKTGVFSLPDFPLQHCNYMGKLNHATPPFAWMECKTGDAAQWMAKLKTRARSGTTFGSSVSGKYVRISMLGSNDDDYNRFVERLSRLS